MGWTWRLLLVVGDELDGYGPGPFVSAALADRAERLERAVRYLLVRAKRERARGVDG